MKRLRIRHRQILRAIHAACLALYLAACVGRAGAANSGEFVVNGSSVTVAGSASNPTNAFFTGTTGSTYAFTIQAGASLGNTTSAGGTGNLISFDNGSVNNAGSLTATSCSVSIANNGTVTNAGTGSLTSSGLSAGVAIGGDGTVNNAGSISGYYAGVHIAGAGGASSVANSGNITGTSSSYYVAGVNLGSTAASEGASSFSLTNSTGGIISGNNNNATGLGYGYGVQASTFDGNIVISNAVGGNISGTSSGYHASGFGISAYSAQNGSITLTNGGLVTGTGASTGSNLGTAYGISAFSAYGTVSIANVGPGSVTGTASGYGALGSGMYASSETGNIMLNNGGTVAYTGNATASSAVGSGIDASSNAGNIDITNAAQGSITGTASGYSAGTAYGIEATDVTGAITIGNSGLVTGMATSASGAAMGYGISAATDAMGAIAILNNASASGSGTITGTGSASGYGIDASSSGGSILITNNATAAGTATSTMSGSASAYGIKVQTLAGTITINNSGTATGTASSQSGSAYGFGMWIQSNSGSVNLSNAVTGVIQASATAPLGTPTAAAIYLTGDGAAATITNRGTISAPNGTGIDASTYGGALTVNAYGGAIIASADAIHLGSGTGTVHIVGLSNISGLMDGGVGTSTLVLNLAGMTPAQKVALQNAVAATAGGGASGLLSVSGVSYSWVNFQSVSGTFDSLEQEVDPGLEPLAIKIDNLAAPLPLAYGRLYIAAASNPESALSSFSGREFLDAFVVLGLSKSTAFSELADARAFDLRSGAAGLDFTGLNYNSGSLIASLGDTQNVLNRLSSALYGGMRMGDSKETTDLSRECDPRWAAWVSGTVTVADESSTPTNPGFSSTSGSPTFGADYRICPDLVVGALFNFTTGGVDFNSGSRLDADTELLGVYADWAHGPWFVNTLVGGGLTRYDQSRSTLAPGAPMALGSPSGDEVLANVTGGYAFKFDGWILSPEAGLLYTHLSKDGYGESGAGAFDLNVDRQEIDSLRTKLGFRVTRLFTLDSIKFTPEAHAFWYHECFDETDGVGTSVPGAPALGSFLVTTNPQGRDFALAGAGLSATPDEFHDNVTFFLSYDAQVGQTHYIAHTVNGGVRVSF